MTYLKNLNKNKSMNNTTCCKVLTN